MNPFLYIPGVPGHIYAPAGGHIRNGYWHPGKIDDCRKCPTNNKEN